MQSLICVRLHFPTVSLQFNKSTCWCLILAVPVGGPASTLIYTRPTSVILTAQRLFVWGRSCHDLPLKICLQRADFFYVSCLFYFNFFFLKSEIRWICFLSVRMTQFQRSFSCWTDGLTCDSTLANT